MGKYADHLPLYRQCQIYAREGVQLERSTLTDWVGQAARLLTPLADAIGRYVLRAEKIHGDDTPIRALGGRGKKAHTGRLWVYVRDDRPSGDKAPLAVWFQYSADRRGEHPVRHLKNYRGILQADAFAGYHELYRDDRIIEAACWSQYLVGRFIRSSWPSRPMLTTCLNVTATPHNSCRRADDGRRLNQCRFRCAPSPVSRDTSPRVSGVTPDCLRALFTPSAAARSHATEAMRARRRRACALHGGTALKLIERSACCRTSLQPDCLERSLRSRPQCEPRSQLEAWNPPLMPCAALT